MMGLKTMQMMKWSSFKFILFIIGSVTTNSIAKTDKCFGRWQTIDSLNIKVTLDWEIFPEENILATEFRTSLVSKGFWYAFGFLSSPNKSLIGPVYVLRWKENDTELFWDLYNVTQTKACVHSENDSSVITFQQLPTSALLTVRLELDLTPYIFGQDCLYVVYMRGRLFGDEPSLPDETLYNQSLCLTCQQRELLFLNTASTEHNSINELKIVDDATTMQYKQDSIINNSPSFNETLSKVNSLENSLINPHEEFRFIWFGRILNRPWLNDYSNLSSILTHNLRLELQSLFLLLINHNSSYSFICNQFDFYSLQSGSILFATNITLISNLPETETINIIEQLIKTVNYSTEYMIKFDPTAHHIIRTNQMAKIQILFKNLSRIEYRDLPKTSEFNPTLNILVACIIGISCMMLLVTTLLCLYAYYTYRREKFHCFKEQQKLKFRHDSNSYIWLGQEPSKRSYSPYLIQSTSI